MQDKTRNHGLNQTPIDQHGTVAESTTGSAKAEDFQADDPLPRNNSFNTSGSHSSQVDRVVNRESTMGDSAALEQVKPSVAKKIFNFIFRRKNEVDAHEEAAVAGNPSKTSWTPQEKRMLANIAELHEARVADLMIPRSDVEALDLETTLAETLKLFEQSGHSRMPVYMETLDDPRGMIHIRDLLNYVTRASGIADIKEQDAVKTDKGSNKDTKQANDPLSKLDLDIPISKLGIIREVLFVPVSMPAGRLLARMQASRTQIALVIDEHGGTDGLVSLEDVVEIIVGDIEDEHDDEDADIIKDAQGRWVLDAAIELEELKEDLGIDFSKHEQAEAVDTIGGLIVTVLDRIPARGEKITLSPKYMVQVLDADQRKIKRVRLSRTEETNSV